MTTECQCVDRGCLQHLEFICEKEATTTVHRTDVDDKTGTPMCEGCATDAVNSGVFTKEVSP
jgi:hypothetical protein